MKLIPDWSIAWRFLSVQAAVLLALLSGLQAEVLPLISPLFPDHVWPWVSGGLALAVVVLRLVAQDGLQTERALIHLDALDAHADANVAAEGSPQPMPSEQWGQRLVVAVFLSIAAMILAICLTAFIVWKSAA